jgi:hypothetical protein
MHRRTWGRLPVLAWLEASSTGLQRPGAVVLVKVSAQVWGLARARPGQQLQAQRLAFLP